MFIYPEAMIVTARMLLAQL